MRRAVVTRPDVDNPVAGDLMIRRGSSAFVEGAEEDAQRLAARLRFMRGEWFADVRQGVPWRERVLGVKSQARDVATSLVRETILKTRRFVRVESISFVFDAASRRSSVAFVAIRDDGSVLRSSDFGPFLLPFEVS